MQLVHLAHRGVETLHAKVPNPAGGLPQHHGGCLPGEARNLEHDLPLPQPTLDPQHLKLLKPHRCQSPCERLLCLQAITS